MFAFHPLQTPHDGETPLHTALRAGYTEVAVALLEAGARVDLKNRWGDTALDVARKYRREESLLAEQRRQLHQRGLAKQRQTPPADAEEEEIDPTVRPTRRRNRRTSAVRNRPPPA